MLTLAQTELLIPKLSQGPTTQAWEAATPNEKEIALYGAIATFDAQSWRGVIRADTQIYSWPRTGKDCQGRVFPETGAPETVLRSLAMLAASNVQQQGVQGNIIAGVSGSESGKIVKRKLEQLGPLKEETEYFQGTTGEIGTGLPAQIQEALKCYLVSSAANNGKLLYASRSIRNTRIGSVI